MKSLGICLVFVFVKHLNDIEKGQLVIEKRKKIRTNRYYGTMEGKALVSSNSSHIQKKGGLKLSFAPNWKRTNAKA